VSDLRLAVVAFRQVSGYPELQHRGLYIINNMISVDKVRECRRGARRRHAVFNPALLAGARQGVYRQGVSHDPCGRDVNKQGSEHPGARPKREQDARLCMCGVFTE
jgi:hypothetical protein